jgi:AcrR family transcriptional regulator
MRILIFTLLRLRDFTIVKQVVARCHLLYDRKVIAKGSTPRPTLRALQAARTRERLLAAAARFFERHPASELTLPKLARLARVTPPTAYTHFGSVERLMEAMYDWLLPQLGTRDPLPVPQELHELPRLRYPRFARHAGVLRSIWTSGTWSRHRGRTRGAYTQTALDNLRLLPGVTSRQARLALGPIMAFSYPPMWQWLLDVAGLEEHEAEAAAAWATEALVAALRDKPPARAKTRTKAKTKQR